MLIGIKAFIEKIILQMIIGKGMISKAFKKSQINHDNLCVFLSGVSNSLEKQSNEFTRELELIKSCMNNYENKKFIYFSTSSIETKKKSDYISHKLIVENFIEKNFNDYLILRLPNVVGKTRNKSQLIPYLFNCLKENKKIIVNTNVYRYLIDVEDLPIIVEYILKFNVIEKKITIHFNNKIGVLDIIAILKNINNFKNSKIEINSIGVELLPKNKFFLKIINNFSFSFNTDPKKILLKYYKI